MGDWTGPPERLRQEAQRILRLAETIAIPSLQAHLFETARHYEAMAEMVVEMQRIVATLARDR